MTGNEIFKRTTAYERDARTIRLHAPEWKLLLAFDGQRGLAEVALSIELSFAETLPLTQKFLNLDWIEEQPITLDQYLQRTGVSDSSTIGAAIPPAVVLHEPEPEKEAAPARTLIVTAAAAPVPLSVPTPAPVTPKAATPPPLSSVTHRLPRGPMRLGSVVDYIVSLAGNSALGQLLVYRVFLRVPPDLLQAEDIVSIHLVNDSSLIRGTALQQAISNAVNEVAKHSLPESVFSPA